MASEEATVSLINWSWYSDVHRGLELYKDDHEMVERDRTTTPSDANNWSCYSDALATS
jgi:hypothetical protein